MTSSILLKRANKVLSQVENGDFVFQRRAVAKVEGAQRVGRHRILELRDNFPEREEGNCTSQRNRSHFKYLQQKQFNKEDWLAADEITENPNGMELGRAGSH